MLIMHAKVVYKTTVFNLYYVKIINNTRTNESIIMLAVNGDSEKGGE